MVLWDFWGWRLLLTIYFYSMKKFSFNSAKVFFLCSIVERKSYRFIIFVFPLAHSFFFFFYYDMFYTILLGWFHSNWRNDSWGFTGFAAAQIWRCGAQYSRESSQRDVHWEGSVSYSISPRTLFTVVHFWKQVQLFIKWFILRVLTEIRQKWARMEFSYEEHYRTATPMLKCSNELIESLEDSQV